MQQSNFWFCSELFNVLCISHMSENKNHDWWQKMNFYFWWMFEHFNELFKQKVNSSFVIRCYWRSIAPIRFEAVYKVSFHPNFHPRRAWSNNLEKRGTSNPSNPPQNSFLTTNLAPNCHFFIIELHKPPTFKHNKLLFSTLIFKPAYDPKRPSSTYCQPSLHHLSLTDMRPTVFHNDYFKISRHY